LCRNSCGHYIIREAPAYYCACCKNALSTDATAIQQSNLGTEPVIIADPNADAPRLSLRSTDLRQMVFRMDGIVLAKGIVPAYVY
jgi:hypothetical protein